ncbi:MAG: T9SS type A sorting domain-containing protein, partial [candidate division WOR-3 bacterium]
PPIENPPTDDSLVFVGTGSGVYYTPDGGAAWQQLNTGLTNTDILSLALQPGPSGLIFAGTNGAGCFSHLPPTGISHSRPAPVPANCKLRTFPNPCRNRLTITLETSPLQNSPLSSSGAVAGAIYDKLGQLICELTPQTVSSGRVCWEIDLRTVSSGVYFLKIQTPNRTITRRVAVVQ